MFVLSADNKLSVCSQDENENEEGDDDMSQSVAMETDSVDEELAPAPLPSSSQSQTLGSAGTKGRKHPFFQRSESTLCLGCPPPDPFDTPMSEALPLADTPQLLQPNARREDLFGIPRQPITVPPSQSNNTPGTYNPMERLPTRLGLSARSDAEYNQISTREQARGEEQPHDLSVKEEQQEAMQVKAATISNLSSGFSN